jgi:murein DD-endopeptidase MepM/ murein hydrolase activator NlpD
VTNQKPIRKDRVALAALIVLAAILLPILLTSEPREPPPSEIDPGNVILNGLEDPIAAGPTPALDPYEILEHRVVEGDTLEGIALELGISVEQLRLSNQLTSNQAPRTGETLRVPRTGFLHRIRAGETLSDLASTYGVTVDELAKVNALVDPARIIAGDWLIVPAAPDDLEVNTSLALDDTVSFQWPLQGEVMSGFGYRNHPVLGTFQHHNGIDIDVPTGTPVGASAAGRVLRVAEEEGMGLVIYLRHAGEYVTVYGHLDEVLVGEGEAVSAGQRIATSGNTGISTGPHLHFEIRHSAEFPVDPLNRLP